MSCLCTMRESCSQCDPELRREKTMPQDYNRDGYQRSPGFRWKPITRQHGLFSLSIASRNDNYHIEVFSAEDAEALAAALTAFAEEKRLTDNLKGL